MAIQIHITVARNPIKKGVDQAVATITGSLERLREHEKIMLAFCRHGRALKISPARDKAGPLARGIYSFFYKVASVGSFPNVATTMQWSRSCRLLCDNY